MEEKEQYKITLIRPESERNISCDMTLYGEAFNWHTGSEEDKAAFRDMLNGFAQLFNKC
jgi:hypothetical protein